MNDFLIRRRIRSLVRNLQTPALALAVLISLAIQAGAETDPGSLDFEGRRAALLEMASDAYAKSGPKPGLGQGFWVAEALMELGRTQDALKMDNAALVALEPGNHLNRWLYGGNSGFNCWPALDFYIRYKDRLDEATKKRYARLYQGAVWYRRLTTSNHKLMAATVRYLATQEWGEHFTPDPAYAGRPDLLSGTRFAATDPTGERYLDQRIDETIRKGCEEYASRPYGCQDILPFLTLAECSRDPAMAGRARQAYECALAELAAVYLQGHLATFSTRSYPDMLAQQPWGVASLLWTYFGGAGVKPKIDWGLRAATTGYRLPAPILAAGTLRAQPYTQRSLNGGWRLTSFMTASYGLFSRSPKGGAKRPVLLGQNYPSGVMFLEPDAAKHSFLWLTNPCADDNAKRSPTGIHTHGASNHEQEVQNQGSLLYVFNIPANAPFQYALGFVPGGYVAVMDETQKEKRLFLAYKSLLIGISSTADFSWNPQAGIAHPASPPAPGDTEFRIMATRFAVAFDTARPDDFPGATLEQKLQEFASEVDLRSHLKLASDSPPTGDYMDHAGNDLTCAFDGDDTINGQRIDYAGWPRLENPWMKFVAPETLEITDGKSNQTYRVGNVKP